MGGNVRIYSNTQGIFLPETAPSAPITKKEIESRNYLYPLLVSQFMKTEKIHQILKSSAPIT